MKVLTEVMRLPDGVMPDGHRLYRNSKGTIIEIKYPEGCDADLQGLSRWRINPELKDNEYPDERILGSVFR